MSIEKIKKYTSELPNQIQEAYAVKEDYVWQAPDIAQATAACLIDHTYLKTDASEDVIKNLCNEAIEYGFYSVCVQPYYANFAKKLIAASNVKIAAVANFPMASSSLQHQLGEIKDLSQVCDEVDFVLPFALVMNHKYEELYSYLLQVRKVSEQTRLKIILETSNLNEEQIIKSGICSVAAKIDFLKTSTGFAAGGASQEVVRLLRMIAGNTASVKASGGIRSYEDLKAMVLAGANRIGCSSGVAIVQNKIASGEY